MSICQCISEDRFEKPSGFKRRIVHQNDEIEKGYTFDSANARGSFALNEDIRIFNNRHLFPFLQQKRRRRKHEERGEETGL